MKISKLIIMMALLVLAVPSDAKKKAKKEALWPNGEVISEWFSDTARVDISTLGRQYVITERLFRLLSTVLHKMVVE